MFDSLTTGPVAQSTVALRHNTGQRRAYQIVLAIHGRTAGAQCWNAVGRGFHQDVDQDD